MHAYDTTDAALGKPLDTDFVLPIASGAAAEGAWVDTRANSLQELAEAGGTAPFAYDTKWATNGVPASLKISCERICRLKDGTIISATTNELLAVDSPAAGDLMQKLSAGKSGFFTYRCSFLDALGQPLGEGLTSSYDIPFRSGLFIVVK